MIHLCTTCQLAAPYAGFDACLQCAVAEALVDDPQYIDFARRLYASDVEWLAQLEAEWERQSNALASASFIRLSVRQAS